MVRVFHLAALALLAVWLPATTHCGLEPVLDWSSEDCAHHDVSTSGEHNAIENGNYRLVQTGTLLVAPLAVVLPWASSDIPAIAADDRSGLSGWIEQPPELTRTWQFVARAALPGNAPSFVS